MCTSVLPRVCMGTTESSACRRKPGDGVGFLEQELPVPGCEPPYGGWETNPGALKEPQMLLTPEPSLQPPE